MAPAKTVPRSRRTHSYSWSSDSVAIRPVYQWPEFESPGSGLSTSTADDDLSDEAPHRTSPGDKDESATMRRPLEAKIMKKVNYDSDSCLTPRSRRTLRRTLSGDTEPWPSLKAPSEKPSLETIYSPTHEILHPMQSLMLEKSMSTVADKSPHSTLSPPSTLIPVRRAMSVDLDTRRTLDAAPKPKPNPFTFETYAFPETPLQEGDDQEDGRDHDRADDREDDLSESTLKTAEDENENAAEGKARSNVVVIIVDAEKKLTKFTALDWAINVAVQPGDEIVILGVLKHISTPSGYKVVANTNPSAGVKPETLQLEVKKTAALFEQRLTDSGRRAECEKKNLKLTVRIAPGARARTVVVRELTSLKATYAIFDRRIMRGRTYYGKHLSCHAVRMRSNGRSTKTIFTMASTAPNKGTSTVSTSPKSDTSSSSSPTHFWRRFAPFRSSRNSRTAAATTSPRSSTASSDATPADSPSKPTSATAPAAHTLNPLSLDSFMAEMQDFSMSLDHSKKGPDFGSKLALQSCVVADAMSYKQGMDAHRIKHRPMSVSVPPLIAT